MRYIFFSKGALACINKIYTKQNDYEPKIYEANVYEPKYPMTFKANDNVSSETTPSCVAPNGHFVPASLLSATRSPAPPRQQRLEKPWSPAAAPSNAHTPPDWREGEAWP